MELRRDERGRPIGLAWPEAPEFTPEQVKRTLNASPNQLANLQVGREPQEWCGAGKHLMSEHGKRRSDNDGRYCTACKKEQRKKWQENNAEKARAARARYREKKRREKAEHENRSSQP